MLADHCNRGATPDRHTPLGVESLVLGLAHCCSLLASPAFAVWNLSPRLATACHSLLYSLYRLANNWSGSASMALALSPDGPHWSMSAIQGVTQQLYLRAMDGLEAKPIPGTEGAVNPFFSPDGQWMGFFAGGKLRRSRSAAGAPVTLSDARSRTELAPVGEQPRHDRFRTRSAAAYPASFGRRRHTAAADSVSKKGKQPPLAGFLPGGKAVLFSCRYECRQMR